MSLQLVAAEKQQQQRRQQSTGGNNGYSWHHPAILSEQSQEGSFGTERHDCGHLDLPPYCEQPSQLPGVTTFTHSQLQYGEVMCQHGDQERRRSSGNRATLMEANPQRNPHGNNNGGNGNAADGDGDDEDIEEIDFNQDKDTPSCQELYEVANCKRLLMAMCHGLKSADNRKLGDAWVEPYGSVRQRSQFIATADDLRQEIIRRTKQMNIPEPKTKWWPKTKCADWLNTNPIKDPVDKAFLIATEAQVVEQLASETKDREKIQEEKNKTSTNWASNEPFLRLYLCMCHDDAREALFHKDDTMDRAALDARNNEERPKTWYEIVAGLFNDPLLVLTTEALPDLHQNFAEPIDLFFDDMPGGEITAEDVKGRYGDARAMLIKIIYDWERSGNGFGQRNLKEKSWGCFTSEHLETEDGDNRANFLRKDYYNKEHLLYLWHLADQHGILSNMLNVLAKDVSIDCDGNVIIDTSKVQHKRKRPEEEEAVKQREFRDNIGSSLGSLAITAAQENLQKVNENILKYEIKAMETEDTPVKMKIDAYVEKQKITARNMEKEIERLQSRDQESSNKKSKTK